MFPTLLEDFIFIGNKCENDLGIIQKNDVIYCDVTIICSVRLPEALHYTGCARTR